jgi:hypothetical protein
MTRQTRGSHLLDELVRDDSATVHRPRVRDHGHATGRTHDLDGPHRVGRVVLDVVGAAATQPPREGLVTVPDDPGRHERVRDVRATGSGARLDLRPDLLDRHGDAVGRHLRDHRIEPGVAAVERPFQLGHEVGVGRVGEVGQQVDALVVPAARDLDARNQTDAVATRRTRGILPAQRRVVVGERDDVQSGSDRLRHDDRGRLGAVARGRVGVQVDEHRPSVVAPRDHPVRQPFRRSLRSAG